MGASQDAQFGQQYLEAHAAEFAGKNQAEINKAIDERNRANRDAVRRFLNANGMTDAQIAHLWNNNPLFRSAPAQMMMAQWADFMQAKQNIKPVRPNVPPVQRPGVAESRATSDSITLSEKMRQFRESPSVKAGAAALMARRRAAANQR